jgi:hypothetical protein
VLIVAEDNLQTAPGAAARWVGVEHVAPSEPAYTTYLFSVNTALLRSEVLALPSSFVHTTGNVAWSWQQPGNEAFAEQNDLAKAVKSMISKTPASMPGHLFMNGMNAKV